MMTKVSFYRGNLLVRASFTRPILDFGQLAPVFNSMIYSSLQPAFAISANDFSTNVSNRLSEICIKFNLYSGPNSIALFSDRLAFEFVNLATTDYPIVLDLLHRVHDAFPQYFLSLECERFETQYLSHFLLLPTESVEQYLARFAMKERLTGFANLGDFFEEPTARISVVSADQSWQSRLSIERSLATANGIFLDLSTILSHTSWGVPFLDKLALLRRIAHAWFASLALESADVFP
jgi:hypothetical protein